MNDARNGLVILLSAAVLLSAGSAQAVSFSVTKTVDTNDGTCDADCSLREAIIAANANPGADEVIASAGTYVLDLVGAGENAAASGDLDITDDLTLSGAGAEATIIDGNATDRVLEIRPGATVTIQDATIRGASITDVGGGVLNNGTLELFDVVISENLADHGGGLYNQEGALTLTRCTVSGNTAAYHGGGIFSHTATLTLVNSTLSDNTTTSADGAGVNNNSLSVMTLENVTITNNSSGRSGGGIANFETVNLGNTIIADNTASAAGPDCLAQSFNPLASQGYNLIGEDTNCAFTPAAGDQVGTGGSPIDPALGPLQDNGGPTKTHAPLAGSPVIDAGDPVACPATDQRGFGRPGGEACDIGAYELICGDGDRAGDEQCDDGNNEDGDGCSAECELETPPVPAAGWWGLIFLAVALSSISLWLFRGKLRLQG